MIENYTAGRMTVDGKIHRRDLKIVGGKVKGEWWRKQGHSLSIDDITDIFEAAPEILVIGDGYASNMRVPESVKKVLKEKNIELKIENTRDAVETFNQLLNQNKNVAGAFHLTC